MDLDYRSSNLTMSRLVKLSLAEAPPLGGAPQNHGFDPR